MAAGDLNLILPEIVLALFAMATLVGAVWTGRDALASLITWTSAAVMVLMALFIVATGQGDNVGFSGMFHDDAFSRFAKVVILISAAVVLLMGESYLQRRDLLRFEYPLLVVLSVIGMMIMVSAGDLMALYMGIELQSLALYVVASLRRDSVKSTEAGLKYFVLGALSSGLLLYGASLTYGFAGTTQFAGIIAALGDDHAPLGLLFGIVLMACGLAFKVSAFPFHMWTPDVYEGAPTPITAFFATAPKVAAIALFARLMHEAFGTVSADWQQIIALLAVGSMFLGSFAAIGQRDIKRLMAYSSIAHMGYALVGLAAGTVAGVEAMMVYMVIYVTMNIGTFAFILSMTRDGETVTDIASLNMFSKADPLRAGALLLLMFSLAGVPPLLGFFGKYAVLSAAVSADMTWLAVAAVLASVVGAFYYIRICYLMYFGEEGDLLDRSDSALLSGLTVGAGLLMLVAVIGGAFGVDDAAGLAALSLAP